MERHFVQELEELKANLTAMGALAERAIRDAIKALLEQRADIAQHVLTSEQTINAMEMRNDDDIIDLLALQQPVASDLRFILAAMKINNDLERIGDHAVNIAESALTNASRPPLKVRLPIPEMSTTVMAMLRDALRGFVSNDPAICHAVLKQDDQVDQLNRETIDTLANIIRTQHEYIEEALEYVRVSRNLERVGDLATNIAEEVIFIAEAQIVKHHQQRSAATGTTREGAA
jgi:phosphate transport system protein